MAGTRYQAADAAGAVEVEYEPLPAVVDLEKALQPGSPRANESVADNVGWDAEFPGGDIDAAFAEAEVVVRQRMLQQRLVPSPMEGRAVLADYDVFEDHLTVWTSTQIPHFIRYFLSTALTCPKAPFAWSPPTWVVGSAANNGPIRRNIWPRPPPS